MSSILTKELLTPAMQAPPTPWDDTQPIVIKPLPIFTRLLVAVRLWLLKAFVFSALGFLRFTSAASFREIAPTYTKAYPSHPDLPCRVFLPKDYKTGSKLPLYIDIHGGGFALCDPQTDDHYCRHFADEFGYCVVSINYRKAPRFPWPIPVHDCADLARDVLKDQDLPVDHDRVVMGGFSAGGNLCLCIAQLDGIREKVQGLVPVYPSVDFSLRFRTGFKADQSGRSDVLKNMIRLFNWAYVPAGTDRRQKTLSPIYASRRDLPQKIFFVGAQYDVLCNEANVMAKKLASIDSDDATDFGTEWNENGIRWEQVPNVQHGFTHVPARGGADRQKKEVCDALYSRIDAWIKSEVFQNS